MWKNVIRFLRVALELPHHWEQRDGWTGKLPFYEMRCEKHGIQYTYPQGYDLILKCPECLKAEKEKF